MLEFRKIAEGMRQFEDNTEILFLSKSADNISEEVEQVQKKQELLKKKQLIIVALINLLTGSNINPNDYNEPAVKEPYVKKNPFRKIDMYSEMNKSKYLQMLLLKLSLLLTYI